MRFWLKQYIYLLPIILLGVDILSLFIPMNFVVVGNIAGYSLLTNLIFIYVFSFGDYCWFTRLAPLGMCAINITNAVGFYMNEKFYNFWYIIMIFAVILFLTIVLELSKRLKR